MIEFNKGCRVRYKEDGKLHRYRGKVGTVQSFEAPDFAVVQWDDVEGTTAHDSANLELVLTVGGVTTPRRTVALQAVPLGRAGGLKHDAGKQRPALLHEGVPLALAEVIKTLTFGAEKYEAHSWKLVENALERYQDASYRHDMARCAGETHDPETGIRHRAHHIINELFLLQLELNEENKE